MWSDLDCLLYCPPKEHHLVPSCRMCCYSGIGREREKRERERELCIVCTTDRVVCISFFLWKGVLSHVQHVQGHGDENDWVWSCLVMSVTNRDRCFSLRNLCTFVTLGLA